MSEQGTTEMTMPPGNVETMEQMYAVVIGQLKSIDEELDEATGGKTAGRRKIVNTLVESHAERIAVGALEPLAFFRDEEVPMEDRVAIYFGLVRKFNEAFSEEANKYVTSLIVDTPPAPAISDEDYKVLTGRRSQAYKQANYIRELLSMFGIPADKMPPKPARRGGGRGKRGPRAITNYTWTLDGERLDPKEDSLKGLSVKLGFDSQTDLRKLMEKADIDLKEPTDPIEFILSLEDSKDDSIHMIRGDKKVVDAEEDDEEEEGEDADPLEDADDE